MIYLSDYTYHGMYDSDVNRSFPGIDIKLPAEYDGTNTSGT